MTALPEWINVHWDSYKHEICGNECILREALAIAWEAINQANHWQRVSGLSAESVIAEINIDLQTAMRRIEELGKE